MLDHANTDDLVEALFIGEISIVDHARLAAVGQAGGGKPCIGFIRLRLTQGNPHALDTVLLCGMQQKPAPATANVEKPLSRLETELAAQHVEFAHLGAIQIIVFGRELRTGIHHAFVEPETLEIIAHVIVVGHRLAIAIYRVLAAGQPGLRDGRRLCIG